MKNENIEIRNAKTTRKKQILKEMEIDLWVQKGSKASNKNHEQTMQSNSPVANMDWAELEKAAVNCPFCVLGKTKTHVVFGVGNKNAEVMFIGEAPGANEDLQGEPFVGRAGMLLNEMLRAIGLKREDVYIANILKCRPPNNRDPLPEEVKVCIPYLLRQIELIHPKMLVAVGRIAAQTLLNTDTPMSQLRGKKYFYGDSKIPVLVTYHPAYLLRSPREKSKAYVDFQAVKALLDSFHKN